MDKIKYYVTISIIILAGVFTLLNRVWEGFSYFVLSCACLLAIFWGVVLIFEYFTEFKKELQSKYAFYKAQKISKNGITSKYYEENEIAFKKEFDKICLKDKILKWCLIVFCFAVALTFLVALIIH